VDKGSGVGVLDKTVAVLETAAMQPSSLGELTERTGLARPTAYRLAVALEHHGLLARDGQGRFLAGPRLRQLAAAAPDPLLAAADPVLAALRDETGESAQLYRREPGGRRCVAAAERATGLRDTVPVGTLLPLTAGSAAQVLLAWEAGAPPAGAAFTARTLAGVRRRGWAATAAEREPGVGSVSAPVREASGTVVAAVSVSGPLDRLGRSPGRRFAAPVLAAAHRLSASLAPRA
jgi:DNA-binding IclR family transcriptional regulator